MDNCTHTLVGIALGKTRLGKVAPLARPALIFAANAPDLDLVAQWFGGKSAYLVHHRGITHSVLGILLETVLLTLLFGWLGRFFTRSRAPTEKPRTHWSGLALALFCALATQPLFDWFNTYGIRPWLPFAHTWYYGDLTAIIDPWLWLLIGGGACLAGNRSWGGSLFYAVIGVAGILFILFSDRFGTSGPIPVILSVWITGVLLFAAARWRGWGKRRPERIIACAAVATTCYLCFLGWSGAHAWSRYHEQFVRQFEPGETLQRHMQSPEPANPFAWTLIAETQQAVYRQPVSLLSAPGLVSRYPRKLDEPAVQAALQTPDGRAWAYFARYPIAEVIHASPAREVLLLDARYPVDPPNRNWCRILIGIGETTEE